MNASMGEMTSGTMEPAIAAPTRPLYWSIRREVWENRSIWVAPLAVAAVTFLSLFVTTIGLPHRRRAVLLLPLAQQRAHIQQPYDMIAVLLMATAFFVSVFYCLDALHGERRDRSILFWKSMPVSDRTAVLAKWSIPMVIVPAISIAVAIVTQWSIFVIHNAVIVMAGLPPTSSAQMSFVEHTLIFLYGAITAVLWYAPLYAWLLLVSAWAKRAAFLWAFLPWAIAGIFARIAFNTDRFRLFIANRFMGQMHVAFQTVDPHGRVDSLSQLTPLRFLATPALWIGFAVAALLISAAVYLRRYREPI